MPNLQSAISHSLNSHSYVGLLLAFVGGVLSSWLPCAVGMLPILIGYVGGYTENSKIAILRQIVLFMLGFALVLTVLGIVASLLGTLMAALVGPLWFYFLGAIAVVMGLVLLEVIHLPLPQFVTKLPQTGTGKWLAPLVLGAAFGAASSPCGTPFIAAILTFISREQNWVLGGLSLFCYALGQSMLLLVAGLFTGLIKQMAVFRRVGMVITRLSAIVFILGGLRIIAQVAGWLDPLAFFP